MQQLEFAVATLLKKTDKLLVAVCQRGFLYYLPLKGKGAYQSLSVGDPVRVHYRPGFQNEVITFEVLGGPGDAP